MVQRVVCSVVCSVAVDCRVKSVVYSVSKWCIVFLIECCNILWIVAVRCIVLQYSKIYCSTVKFVAVQCKVLHYSVKCCSTV